MRQQLFVLSLLYLLSFSCNTARRKTANQVKCTHILNLDYKENNNGYKVLTYIQRRIVNQTDNNIYFFLSPPIVKNIIDNDHIVYPIGFYEWRKIDSLAEDDKWIIPPDTLSSNKLKNYIVNQKISIEDPPSWLPTFIDNLICIKKNSEVIMEYPSYGLFEPQKKNNFKVFTTSIGRSKRNKLQSKIDVLFPKEFLGYKYWQDDVISDTLWVNIGWLK